MARLAPSTSAARHEDLRALTFLHPDARVGDQRPQAFALPGVERHDVANIHGPPPLLLGGFLHDSHASVDRELTDKQGQYLAFIHAYLKLNRRPPAETDMQRF